jgi:hypothetical protein
LGFFRAIASLLIIIATYSAGAVLGHRLRIPGKESVARPSALDGALVLLCWIAAGLIVRSGHGVGTAVVIGFSIALVLAFACHYCVTRSTLGILHRDPSSTVSRSPDSGILVGALGGRGWHLLANARSLARDAAGFQSRLYLSAVYFVILAPFGIFVGRLGDPLKMRLSTRDSYWTPKEPSGQSFSDARRQS